MMWMGFRSRWNALCIAAYHMAAMRCSVAGPFHVHASSLRIPQLRMAWFRHDCPVSTVLHSIWTAARRRGRRPSRRARAVTAVTAPTSPTWPGGTWRWQSRKPHRRKCTAPAASRSQTSSWATASHRVPSKVRSKVHMPAAGSTARARARAGHLRSAPPRQRTASSHLLPGRGPVGAACLGSHGPVGTGPRQAAVQAVLYAVLVLQAVRVRRPAP